MTDRILIPDGPWHGTLVAFVAASALAGCTTVVPDGHAASVTARWPVAGFSRGEQLLWRLLDSLATGDLADAFDRLDAHSLAALIGTVQGMARAAGVVAA